MTIPALSVSPLNERELWSQPTLNWILLRRHTFPGKKDSTVIPTDSLSGPSLILIWLVLSEAYHTARFPFWVLLGTVKATSYKLQATRYQLSFITSMHSSYAPFTLFPLASFQGLRNWLCQYAMYSASDWLLHTGLAGAWWSKHITWIPLPVVGTKPSIEEEYKEPANFSAADLYPCNLAIINARWCIDLNMRCQDLLARILHDETSCT